LNIKKAKQPIPAQQGAVTMFVILILMMVMTMLALTAGKFAHVEQETTGADYRAKEASATAASGLEYALAWLDDDHSCENCVSGTTLDFESASVANQSIPDITNGNTGYSYNPSVSLTGGNSFADGYLLLESSLGTVTGSTESGITITATEKVYVTRWNEFLTGPGENPPPIVINGCLTNVVGNPDIFPQLGQPAIHTLATTAPVDWNDIHAPTSSDCLDAGHMDVILCGGDTCAEDDGRTETRQTGPYLSPFLTGSDHTSFPEPQAWNHIFSISLADAKQAAADAGQTTHNKNALIELQPTNSNYVPFIHLTGTGPVNGVYGTPNYPVVLIFSHSSCPAFNGGAIVYGFLYYEDPDHSCNGMGGARVVGSTIFEGNADQLNSGSEFYSFSNLNGGDPGGPLFVANHMTIPGTWHDW